MFRRLQLSGIRVVLGEVQIVFMMVRVVAVSELDLILATDYNNVSTLLTIFVILRHEQVSNSLFCRMEIPTVKASSADT